MPRRKPYRLHPEASLEFEAADEWYLSRSYDTSGAFLSDVYDAMEQISAAPQRWPKYLYGTRRFVLHSFPFSIVYLYLDEADSVTIVAVAHSKRRPGYWKGRA